MNGQHLSRALRENKFVRFLTLPAARIQAKIRTRRFQKSEDSQYLKGLKDIHKGERCFIIGNGPSLLPKDLDTLLKAGEICFASNRIYNIYSQTSWRPTYYMCVDIFVAVDEIDNIKRIGEYPKFINYKCAAHGRAPTDHIHYLCTSDRVILDPYKMASDTLSSDLSKCGTRTGTVTVNAIELAIYMGFKTIYLLGVDNNYSVKRLKDGTIFVDPSVQSSYFKGAEGSKNPETSIQTVEYLNESYEVAKKFSKEEGVKVYNATRGGKLETFERVDFDELMGQMKHERGE